jgi:hypothetical protein
VATTAPAAQVARYIEDIRQRTYGRWTPPEDTPRIRRWIGPL